MPRARELHDRYFRQAKAEGYAARSAYKLKQINERRTIIRPGDAVLDLGCSPGSWIQVASEIAGERGAVVGVDLKPVSIRQPRNVRTIVADAFETDPEVFLGLLAEIRGHKSDERFGAIISDMAPSTSGAAGGRDHFRSVALCRRVLEIVPALLRPGGRLVMKVLEGEAYTELLDETHRLFRWTKGYKPDASRDVSSEMFILATGFDPEKAQEERPRPRGAAPAAPEPRAGWST